MKPFHSCSPMWPFIIDWVSGIKKPHSCLSLTSPAHLWPLCFCLFHSDLGNFSTLVCFWPLPSFWSFHYCPFPPSPLLPVFGLSTPASAAFLTLICFRPGFCLSLTSFPLCLWPPCHPVSDLHSTQSPTLTPYCLWPPLHLFSDLHSVLLWPLLHTVSDLHSTLCLTSGSGLSQTSIPHFFFFFLPLPSLAHLSLTFSSHYLAASDLHSCLSLTSSPHCLWPPLPTLTSSPLCLTSPLLPVSDLWSMLSDFPFTQSQTSPSLPTSDIYACLCLWAVHLHPCLTNNPFSLRCPSWGFSAQLCVIVFGLLTSFYPLVSIGLLSLCEVPLPGLEYSLHFYCLVFGWHPETVPGLLQDLKLSLFCHPPWAASLVFKVFVNAVYLFMKCESVVKSLVWLLSSLTVNFWWFPLCGRKCVCLKDNLYLSVKKFYNFGEDCQKIKMLPICVQVVCFVFCFYTENDAFYTYIFLTLHWSWLCVYGVWLLCVYIGLHMKYGILFDWYKPCYILLYGKRAHFIQCCMCIVYLKHHSDWLIHHLSSCHHFIKFTWWPKTVLLERYLCVCVALSGEISSIIRLSSAKDQQFLKFITGIVYTLCSM